MNMEANNSPLQSKKINKKVKMSNDRFILNNYLLDI